MSKAPDDPTAFMQRIQSQVDLLVPLLEHLRRELGKDTANALVYPALRQSVKRWVADFASQKSDDPLENFADTSQKLEALFDGDVDYKILQDTSEHLDFNVSACRYAELFRELGEPELGAILVCEADHHIADLSAPHVELTLEQTLMKGATHCPFRYQFKTEKT